MRLQDTNIPLHMSCTEASEHPQHGRHSTASLQSLTVLKRIVTDIPEQQEALPWRA
jgi:hypothetical protein